MRPTLTMAALIAASPALAGSCPPGQFYRVRLAECVSLSSPLARPYLGAWSSQKNRAEGETIDTANLGEEALALENSTTDHARHASSTGSRRCAGRGQRRHPASGEGRRGKVTRQPRPYFYLLSRRRVGCNAGGVGARRLNRVHECAVRPARGELWSLACPSQQSQKSLRRQNSSAG